MLEALVFCSNIQTTSQHMPPLSTTVLTLKSKYDHLFKKTVFPFKKNITMPKKKPKRNNRKKPKKKVTVVHKHHRPPRPSTCSPCCCSSDCSHGCSQSGTKIAVYETVLPAAYTIPIVNTYYPACISYTNPHYYNVMHQACL